MLLRPMFDSDTRAMFGSRWVLSKDIWKWWNENYTLSRYSQ